MTGITKRGSSYRFVVSMGRSGDYKIIRKYDTYTPPAGVSPERADRLAEAAYQEFKQHCKGETSLNENMRFRDLGDKYFKEYAPNELKEVTTYNYEIAVRTHLNPRFGNCKLKEITTAQISEFLTTLDVKGSTSRKQKIILQSVFEYAVGQGFIKTNPCVGAIYKSQENEGDPNFLDKGQAKALLKLVDEYSVFNTIIKVLLFTGMRSGECLGLRWSSINFENNTITIDKTLTYANNRWYLEKPKTKSSLRTISIDDNVIEFLTKHKEKQDKAKAAVGEAWLEPDMVFTSCTGHFYDRSLLNTQFRRLLKNHPEIPYISIHGLRHTNASLLIYAHEDISVISKYLGHSSVDITSRIYMHMFSEVNVRVSKSISAALL